MAKKKDSVQVEMPVTEKRESIYEMSERLKREQAEKEPKPKSIPIEHLYPYPDHPYKVLDDEAMDALTESIRERGVMTPILVRERDHDPYRYNIIAGHRRVHAAQKTGLRSVPAFICNVSRDEAAIMVVDSNLHRERILPSEKARAYKMWYDAKKRTAGRPPKNSSQLETKLDPSVFPAVSLRRTTFYTPLLFRWGGCVHGAGCCQRP